LDRLFAIIGVHEDSVTILRKPLVTGLTTQQMGLVLAIPSTGCDVPVAPDPVVFTFRIRTKMTSKIYHPILLSPKGFHILHGREADGKKINND
jgi:hypothetical protein